MPAKRLRPRFSHKLIDVHRQNYLEKPNFHKIFHINIVAYLIEIETKRYVACLYKIHTLKEINKQGHKKI